MASALKTSNYFSGIPILIIAFLSFCCPALAADVAADSFSEQGAKKMGKLETKFFQHSYPKDEPQVRLERLEKLVFGAPKTGAVNERLNALVQAVPSVEKESTDEDATKTADTQTGAGHKANRAASGGKGGSRDSTTAGEGTSEYPAVTAMERKVLGKDYLDDPISQRLARLETKEFGRPSTSTDLSERVDRLKQRIGVDIARVAPMGSDWADDDDEDSMSMPIPAGSDSVAKAGEDGRSFSGRDLRSDMRKAFGGMSGSRSYGGSSGAYGMGGSGSSSSGGGSGAYGFGGSGSSGMSGMGNSSSVGVLNEGDEDNIPIAQAPPRPRKHPSTNSPLATMDLPTQVTALEKEIFGKAHSGDPLLTRLNRLETAVFPQQKPASDQPLPDRVKRLMAVVPVSDKQLSKKSKHADDLDDSDTALMQGTNGQAQSHIGKVANSLSSFFSGGSVGGYPMRTQTYVTDPQTGMLRDPYTGTLIDPSTGAVVGSTTTMPMYGGGTYGSGLGNYGGYNSFNNGFSPFGNPYGGGYGTGLRFGVGGGRMGGLWP